MVVVANSRIELKKLFAKKIYYEAVKKKKGKKKKKSLKTEKKANSV